MNGIAIDRQARIQLATHVYHQIVACARAGKPDEVCGLVRGRGSYGFEAVPGRNVAADPAQNYEIDLKTVLLSYEFERSGDSMIGVYHSHPVSEAYPSAMDAWNAFYPELVYFICSLEDDSNPVLRAFSMKNYPVSIQDRDISINIRSVEDDHSLSAQLLCIKTRESTLHLREIRPDLHGYATHQMKNNAIADLCSDYLEQRAPFYVLCSYQHDRIADLRIVEIQEHVIQLV